MSRGQSAGGISKQWENRGNMYENILHQEITARLEADIKSKAFPGSVLFFGPPASGKLTIALETARVLSCANGGSWQCTCPSCKAVKALTSQSIMLMGPKECSLEIAAAREAFLRAVVNEASYLDAARHLFLRAVRKLTMRFNPILWEGESAQQKAAAAVGAIDELLETIDYPNKLPSDSAVEKTAAKIEELCVKAESTLLYDTIPIALVRNVSYWSRLKSASGKRVVIIEAADKMLEGVRNSLLKILEEPPDDCVFILTTRHRAAVMPTILSRVRTYTLRERTESEQSDVINKIFHKAIVRDNEGGSVSITGYLDTYLPTKLCTVRQAARDYIKCVASVQFPDAGAVAKTCASFKPRTLLAAFMDEAAGMLRPLYGTQLGSETAAECMDAMRTCAAAIGTYNIGAAAALESLFASLSRINSSHERVLSSLTGLS